MAYDSTVMFDPLDDHQDYPPGWAWSRERFVWEAQLRADPAYQRASDDVDEGLRHRKEQCRATGPHYTVVNKCQYVDTPEFETEGGHTIPKPVQKYELIPFGPVDDWGFQHALKHPVGQPVLQEDLCAERWADHPFFQPLRWDSEDVEMEDWGSDINWNGLLHEHQESGLASPPPSSEEGNFSSANHPSNHTPYDLSSTLPSPPESVEDNFSSQTNHMPNLEHVQNSVAPPPEPPMAGAQAYFSDDMEQDQSLHSSPPQTEPDIPSVESIVEAVKIHKSSSKKEGRRRTKQTTVISKPTTRSQSKHSTVFYELDWKSKAKELPAPKSAPKSKSALAVKSGGISKKTSKAKAARVH